MDRKPPLPRLCFLISVALTLVGVILRTVCILTQFDASVGYFDRGVLSVADTALYFVAVIGSVVMALCIPKGTLPLDLDTPRRLPFALAVGLSLVAFTALSFIFSYKTLFTTAGAVRVILTFSGLLSATYFFLSLGYAEHGGRLKDWMVALGLLPLVWSMTAISVTYTDPYVPMNSPIKLGLQMGLLGCMLIMIAELRYRLGKARPRAAVALTGMGMYLALTASIPLLARPDVVSDRVYPLCAAVLLMVGAYAGYMLFCYTRPLPALPQD